MMSKRLSVKRRASLKVRVAEMNAAKLKRQSYDSSDGPSTTSPSENPASFIMDDMLELPAPLESLYEGGFNSSDESNEDGNSDDDNEYSTANKDDI